MGRCSRGWGRTWMHDLWRPRSARHKTATKPRSASCTALCSRSCCNYVRSLVGPVDAEDVASEAWLQIARDLPNFRGGSGSIRGWAARIARNRALDHIRARSRRPVSGGGVDELVQLPDRADTAGEALDAVATDRALAAIAALPREQAEAVLLRVVMGLDSTSAARVLGKRAGSVRMATHRGLRRLAEILEYDHGDGSTATGTPTARHPGAVPGQRPHGPAARGCDVFRVQGAVRKWDERQHPTRSRIHGPAPPGPRPPPAPAPSGAPRRELAGRAHRRDPARRRRVRAPPTVPADRLVRLLAAARGGRAPLDPVREAAALAAFRTAAAARGPRPGGGPLARAAGGLRGAAAAGDGARRWSRRWRSAGWRWGWPRSPGRSRPGQARGPRRCGTRPPAAVSPDGGTAGPWTAGPGIRGAGVTAAPPARTAAPTSTAARRRPRSGAAPVPATGRRHGHGAAPGRQAPGRGRDAAAPAGTAAGTGRQRGQQAEPGGEGPDRTRPGGTVRRAADAPAAPGATPRPGRHVRVTCARQVTLLTVRAL